jgi:Spy/CpxP family protein refolding chaperone
MKPMRHLALLITVLAVAAWAAAPAAAQTRPEPPGRYQDLGRALDDALAQLQRWGSWSGEGPGPGGMRGDRPLISMALRHRAELGLSGSQVEALERLRSDFQREAIRREADIRVAEMDLSTLVTRDPADMAAVEAKVREIERLRADLRIARIRTLEQGRAQLTAEQREKLRALLAEPRPPLGSGPPGPPPQRGRL